LVYSWLHADTSTRGTRVQIYTARLTPEIAAAKRPPASFLCNSHDLIPCKHAIKLADSDLARSFSA